MEGERFLRLLCLGALLALAAPSSAQTGRRPRPLPPPSPPIEVPPGGLAAAGAFVTVLLLAVATSLCQPATRLRGLRRTRLIESCDGPVRIVGAARPDGAVLSSPTGRHPALYLREISSRFSPIGSAGRRAYRWSVVHSTCEAVSFLLDDGSAVARVQARPDSFYPQRVARFYNGVPVETWHEQPYPDDTRTELRYVPPDAPVTVVGWLTADRGGLRILHPIVVEGDVAWVGRERARLAFLLGLLAVVIAATTAVTIWPSAPPDVGTWTLGGIMAAAALFGIVALAGRIREAQEAQEE